MTTESQEQGATQSDDVLERSGCFARRTWFHRAQPLGELALFWEIIVLFAVAGNVSAHNDGRSVCKEWFD